MSSFAIKYPFFILMFCLMVIVVGVSTVLHMPVDLFPQINIPVVVVATFYSGCLLYTSPRARPARRGLASRGRAALPPELGPCRSSPSRRAGA